MYNCQRSTRNHYSNAGACAQAVGDRVQADLGCRVADLEYRYKDHRGFPAESIGSFSSSANTHVVVDTFAGNICAGTFDQSFTIISRLQEWSLSVKCMPHRHIEGLHVEHEHQTQELLSGRCQSAYKLQAFWSFGR